MQITSRQEELMALSKEELVIRLLNWESEISAVMPLDFKDWWQNSKEEWPLVTKEVITNLREREEIAWSFLEK